MEGFQPKYWYELTKEERTKALKYLMYLKEKDAEELRVEDMLDEDRSKNTPKR